MADGVVAAGGGVQPSGSVLKAAHFGPGGLEIGDAGVEVGGVPVEERSDVLPGRALGLADGDDPRISARVSPAAWAALTNRRRASAAAS